MAVKILSGGFKNQNPEKKLLKKIEPEASTPERLGVGLGTSILGYGSNLAQSIVDTIGLPSARGGRPDIAAEHATIPTSTRGQRDIYAEKIGVSRKSLEPQGKVENFAELLAQDSPYLLYALEKGGLSAAGKAAEGIVGANLGMEAGNYIGGPVGGIIGSYYGSKAGSKIRKGFSETTPSKPKNVLTHLNEKVEDFYSTSKKELAGKKAPVQGLSEALTPIYDEIASGHNTKADKEAMKNILATIEKANFGKIDLNTAIAQKKSFGNLARASSQNPFLQKMYGKAGDAVRDWIYSLEPEFGKGISAYKQANELYPVVKSQREFERVVNESTELKKILNQSFLKNITLGVGKKAGLIPASRLARFFDNPEAVQYWKDSLRALDLGNNKEAKVSLMKLGRYAQKFEKEDKDQSQSKYGKVKILTGGFK